MCCATSLPPDTLVGLDLGIALPFADCGAFFPRLDGEPAGNAPSLWALIDRYRVAGKPNLGANAVVAHPALRPYFRDGAETGEHFGCDGADHGRGPLPRDRTRAGAMGCKPYSNFNLVGAAQVGKSSLTGMRMLHRLARDACPSGPSIRLPATGSAVVEIYTSLAALEAGRSATPRQDAKR